MYRFGVVKSFWKRGNTELVVINTIVSDFTTSDISVELSEYNFLVGVDIENIYNYWYEQITKEIEKVKKELKSVRKNLRDLKKSSYFSKRRFKNFVDSLQNVKHIPN